MPRRAPAWASATFFAAIVLVGVAARAGYAVEVEIRGSLLSAVAATDLDTGAAAVKRELGGDCRRTTRTHLANR
eukprot:5905269-Pleurochrysis_carterae.AAC.2